MYRFGSESGDVSIYETETGKQIDTVIERVNMGTAGGDLAWLPDGSGYYYTRYPRVGERPEEDLSFYQQLWLHKLDAPVEEDKYIIGKDFPRIGEIRVKLHPRTKIVLLTLQYGDSGQFSFYLIYPDGAIKKIIDYDDGIVEAAFGPKNDLYLISRKEAPRGKILRTSFQSPQLKTAKTIIPESDAAITNWFYSKSKFVVTENYLYIPYQLGGPSEIRLFDHNGNPQPGPEMLPVSSIHEVTLLDNDEILFSNSSYIVPKTWYHFSPAEGKTVKTALASTSPVDYSDSEVLREFAASKDGTQIPLNIIRKKDIQLNGSNPVLLTGYGGYNSSKTPSFSAIRRVWIEQGGVYAVANIRGGGEFGEEWHRAGMLAHKQNCFDDFAAAMLYLIDAGYCTPEKLAITGGSNGGLLMGAMITQHPDLFKATVSTVGVYDMIRVELTPNGQFNIPEYGSVTNPEHFRAMLDYSPYHNVKESAAYPAILFMTGANDPRVDPMNSRKFTARLQAANTSGAPILLRTSGSTGHGHGTPLDEKINQYAATYAFLFYELGVEYMSFE
jgi:prolyl oligopeptidase